MADLPIKIGMKGVFQGKPCTVISLITFSMVEDGDKYYWDEYELKFADGKVATLEFDDDRWKTMSGFTPTSKGPLSTASPGAVPFHDGEVKPRVTLVSRYKVEAVEGNPSYEVEKGDGADYLDAEAPGRLYGAEWSGAEAEFYRGGYLTRSSVAAIFPEIAKAEEEARMQDELVNGPKRLCAWTAWTCCIAAFLGGIYGVTTGTRVEHARITMSAVPAEGARYGPFALKPEEGVYRLTARATLTESSAWVSAVAERADEMEISASSKDMWDESGVDSDGRWHESALSATRYFTVSQPGDYFVRLYAEPDSDRARGGDAGFELEKNTVYPPWLFLYATLCGAIGLLCSLTVRSS